MSMDIEKTEKEKQTLAQALTRLSWGVIALVLINVFLVVALIGPRFIDRQTFRPMMLAVPHGEFMLDGMTRVLTPEDAAILRSIYKEQAGDLRAAHEGVRKSMDKLMDVFEDEKTDHAAVQTALTNVNRAHQEVQTAIGKLVEKAYTKLSPEGRRRLSLMKPERMNRSFEGYRGQRGPRGAGVRHLPKEGNENDAPLLPPPPIEDEDMPMGRDDVEQEPSRN